MNDLPRKPGTHKAEQQELSKFTEDQLRSLGWVPGDPVPGNFAEKVAEIQKRYDEEERKILADAENFKLPVGKSSKPFTPLAKLPTELQTELKDLLQLAKDEANAPAAPDTSPSIPDGMDPKLHSAFREAVDAATQDDRTSPADQPANATAATQAAPTQEAGGQIELNCPHCGWDVRNPEVTEPSDADKRAFLAAMLSGSRFYKQYKLFDGSVLVTFRTLTSEESMAALQLMKDDVKAERYMSDVEYLNVMHDYRLAMGLDNIMSSSARLLGTPPDITMLNIEGLRSLHQKLLSEGLKSESLRRVVGQHYHRFQRLVEMLEVRSVDPNFWGGTESAH